MGREKKKMIINRVIETMDGGKTRVVNKITLGKWKMQGREP